jgi:effector-binding domain-containing protein
LLNTRAHDRHVAGLPSVIDCRVVEIIRPARVEERPDRTYVGVRVVTPFRGMLKVRDELLEEVRRWIEQSEAEPVGHGFLRLHVIDMDGPMDIEVGYFTRQRCTGDRRVRPGLMPEGRYATLTYRDHAMRANRALIEWARENGVDFDGRAEPEGDAFVCRYEAYLTDPKREPRKTKWEVELAIKIAD